MKKIYLICFSLICIFLTSCTPKMFEPNDDSQIVKIYLEQSEDYSVLSSNPAYVERGEDAIFEIEIDEDKEFASSNYGVVNEEETMFIVENVQYSMNVSFLTSYIGDCVLTIDNDSTKGDYIITPKKKGFNVGEEITIKVTPKDDNEFMCYSMNAPYRRDDLEATSGMAISFEEEYTFIISKDTNIFINYFSKNKIIEEENEIEQEIIRMEYDSNGGVTIDGSSSFEVDYRIIAPAKNPTTILGTYYLFKEGYTLESYNTSADGSGTRVGIGSKVDIDFLESNKITLYAQWKKWTDYSNFEYEILEDDTISITKYIGSTEVSEIVVPNIIDNKIVSTIETNAFDGLSIENLILNLDLKIVKDNAVINCSNLESLLMFTNILEITKKAINSTTLQKLYINTTVYTDSKNIHTKDLSSQIDQIEAMENERVIFVGFSTLRYNHDYSPFKTKYPDKDFYVYGMQAGANFGLPLDILTNYLDNDDTVVISLIETSIRANYVGDATIEYLKYNFDLLLNINYQDYKDILFSSYVLFIDNMLRGFDNYVYTAEQMIRFDKYGSFNWGGQGTENINNYDPSYIPSFEKYQLKENLSYIENIMDKSQILASNRYITWSTYNQNSITDYSIFDGWEEYVRTNLTTFRYFDSIRENIYPGNYFRENDSTHLSFIGSASRINRWLNQIPLS